jgi:hypothetical protein
MWFERRAKMKGVFLKGMIFVAGIAAIWGIKMLDLPWYVTIGLVGVLVIGMIWIILPSEK